MAGRCGGRGPWGDLTGLGEYKENRGGVGDGEGGVGAWFGHTPAGVPRTYDLAVTTGQLSGAFGITISRREGGVDAVQNLGGHQSGPEGLCSALTDLGFEIQGEECLKDIAGQEGHQQEALDGVGVMFVDVVGMPAVDQFVEPMILDIPALVA